MLVFVQQLLYFCTAEVIEPNWQNLMARVDTDDKSTNGKQVVNRTVDELMQDHVDFLDTCLKECMLTQGKLLKVQFSLGTYIYCKADLQHLSGPLQADVCLYNVCNIHV